MANPFFRLPEHTRKTLLRRAATGALIALLGTGAMLTLETVAGHEGLELSAYRDPVGIWTKCFGDTRDVTPGATYTLEQCLESLAGQVEAHAAPVLACVPGLASAPDKVKAAMISMAYNIGVSAFCASSVARHANAGNWRRACARMADIYTTAGGKPLAGLVRRRAAESAMCLEGVEEKERGALPRTLPGGMIPPEPPH